MRSLRRLHGDRCTNQIASAEFKVRVLDTTPPALCHLPDIKVATARAAAPFVIFNTCAKDIVDGPVGVRADHPSGSFFPVGKTLGQVLGGRQAR